MPDQQRMLGLESCRIYFLLSVFLPKEKTMPFGSRSFAILCLVGLLPLTTAGAQSLAPDALKAQVDKQMPALTATYKQLHQHPELSHHEEQTSAFLAGELRKAGYEVTEHIGKYEDGSKAWGIVGILKNGAGPTVL